MSKLQTVCLVLLLTCTVPANGQTGVGDAYGYQPEPEKPRVTPPIPTQGPLSGVGQWRYRQSMTQYYAAKTAENRMMRGRFQLELARMQIEREQLRRYVQKETAARISTRLRNQNLRAEVSAGRLLRSIRSNTMHWPVALQCPEAQSHLNAILRNIEGIDRYDSTLYDSGEAFAALDDIIRSHASREERIEALKTLASLKRISRMNEVERISQLNGREFYFAKK